MMRLMSALIALVALAALAMQWAVSAELMAGAEPTAVVWRMLAYLTVLGNIAVLFIMTRAVLTHRIRARQAGAITAVMILIGLGYHGVLSGVWQPAGRAWWADQGLHTVVPGLTCLWWLAFAPKSGLSFFQPVRWLIWPILYADYALVRGLASGFYPYPFLDVGAVGIGQVILNICVLAAAFVAIGLLLVSIAKFNR
jgi:hypothetical protein